MRFEIVSSISDQLYDDIQSFEHFSIYHSKAWHEILKRTFGWSVCGIIGLNDHDDIVWMLPYITKRRMFTHQVNVCLPISHHVGPATRAAANTEQSALNRLPDMDHLEIHDQIEHTHFQNKTDRFVTILDLTPFESVDALFKNLNKSSIQRKIKKAQKEESLETIRGTQAHHIEAFTQMQAQTRRRQGSPTYPQAFFHHLQEQLGEQCHFFLTYQQERPVSGIVFLHDYNQKRAIYGYGASIEDRDIWKLGVNQLTMWAAIQHAFETGLESVDFGTTPVHQTELRQYKEKWNANSYPLYYAYRGLKDSVNTGIKRDALLPRLISEILKQLPLPLFIRLSPFLMKEVV